MDIDNRINADKQRELIKFNREVLYRIPKKYQSLNRLLSDMLRNELLRLYKQISKKEMFCYHGRYTFYMDNIQLTYKVRQKSTPAVTNRHFNFLCAIGLINKSKPYTKINKKFMEENPDKNPINTYYLKKYDEKELDRLNNRSKRLVEAKVTAGNISNDRLKIVGLTDIAKEVYPLNNENSLNRKQIQIGLMFDKIESDIEEQGYSTKPRLHEYFCDVAQVNKLFSLFNSEILNRYSYKRPNYIEKELYHLKGSSWIIIRKDTEI